MVGGLTARQMRTVNAKPGGDEDREQVKKCALSTGTKVWRPLSPFSGRHIVPL